jgi:hypothetical protein
LFSETQFVRRSQTPEEESTETTVGRPGGIEGRGADIVRMELELIESAEGEDGIEAVGADCSN